ncbi:hypothetical protein IPJ72_07040 [Candidatus Peregrinibacteria bacterium]|nr:MAG: hypothetical protein IPJ72_07040 [Candidatus Peregrinibacteria bacterium]
MVEAFGNNVNADKTYLVQSIEASKPTAEAAADPRKNVSYSLGASYAAIEANLIHFNTNQIDQLYAIADAIPLLKLNEQPIDFKIPWLSYAQIQDAIRDFNQTIAFYQRQVNDYRDLLETYVCPDATDLCELKRILNTLIVDIDGLISSLQANIAVLQSYAAFPRQFDRLQQDLADYVYQISRIVDSYADMFGGWLSTIHNQVTAYVEVVLTIQEVVKNIRKIIDVFVDFEDHCDICTNERYANFGWYSLLGLVIPELPVIQFPKWPDLVIDLSDVKAQVNLEVPVVHLIPEPIVLPTIPRISFPKIPRLQDLELLAQLPTIPVLPALPSLPELPPLPAVPVVDLPTLPPPPKLPDIGQSFDAILPLIEQMLNAWCLIKKSLTPVPEGYLKDHITLLTNRPAYMTPLDLLRPTFPKIPAGNLGFDEVRVEAKVHLGLRIKAAFEAFADLADEWNGAATDFSKLIAQASADAAAAVQQKIQAAQEEIRRTTGVDDLIDTIENLDQVIEDAFDREVQQRLDDAGIRINQSDFAQMLQDSERDLARFSESLTTLMGSGTQAINEQLARAVDAMNQAVAERSEEWRAQWRAFLADTLVQWLLDRSQAVQNLEQYARDHQFDQAGVQDALNELNRLMDPDRRDSLSMTPAMGATETRALNDMNLLVDSLNRANRSAVDYRTVMADLGVPSARLPERPSVPDGLKTAQSDLLAYLNRVKDERQQAKETDDLFTLLAARSHEHALTLTASRTGVTPESAPVVSALTATTSFDESPRERLAQQTPATLPSSSSSSSAPTGGVCVGSCLVDPLTHQLVSFIPYLSQPATHSITFADSWVPQEPHAVYSDQNRAYVKQNDRARTPIRYVRSVAQWFVLDDFSRLGSVVLPVKRRSICSRPL